MRNSVLILCAVLVCVGCNREPGSRVLTKGTLTVAVDEAIVPVMTLVIDEFQRQYPDAKLTIRPMPARDAVVAFASDSVRVVVCSREFNTEEKNALAGAKVPYQDNRVAMSAIAVIAHRSNPRSEMRVGELDSMFTGSIARWKGKSVIDLCIGGQNSSTNELFRNLILQGKPFALSATPYASSSDLIEHVRRTPAALGIVNLAWLKGVTQELTIVSLGKPGVSADSTEPAGKFYSPAQAYVYKGYYPINAPIFIYSREMVQDLALGLVSFVASPPGQKVFLNNGLVPQTQPIRLVEVSSNQVN